MMLVRLTAEGRGYFDEILPDYFRRVAAVMSQLTAAERKTLVSLDGQDPAEPCPRSVPVRHPSPRMPEEPSGFSHPFPILNPLHLWPRE